MKILRTLSLTLAVAIALMMLGGCVDTQARLQHARTEIAATLPAPYFEDLVTEAVDVDGNRLVLSIRSPAGDAARTREATGFDALKQSEQRALYDLCALPEIAQLVDSDAILVRRFVDRNDVLFFEIELPARKCSTPPAEPPVQP
ncbi:hypothetical protein [Pseudoxanthomonas sp. PXM01]|uniref:hypothetical protein n=1 Tax=Pseudoxanthomonas sp. PXM01 TaxID=2769295 RepID=UPI001782E34D|nr:hypothetical protein [Pseudoxanthomonas sp. PXM01]MBD9470280.1 hypothetical protein [Pseudoxanthomonas sp. PXM01]